MKNSYRDTARDLKKLGLVKYDLRRELSSGQKSQITKILNRLSDTFGGEKAAKFFLNNPKEFHVAKVGAKTQAVLADSGFKLLPNGKAVIPKKGADSVKVKKGSVTYKRGNVTYEDKLVGAEDFFPTLKKLSKKKLPRNQMLTVQVGDNLPFQRARFSSYADLYRYLQEWKPNLANGDTKEKVMSFVSIVTINKSPTNAPKKAAPKNKRRS